MILCTDNTIRRLHVPLLKHKKKFPVHPLLHSTTTSIRTACAEATSPISLKSLQTQASCMSYDPLQNLLVVGGSSNMDSTPPLCELSLWKMSDSPPYAELMNSTKLDQTSGGNFLSNILSKFYLSSASPTNVLKKLQFSMDGKKLLGIDSKGNITIWDTTHLSSLYTHSATSSSSSEELFDACWWNNTSIVTITKEGQLSITKITTGTNSIELH
jgi:WD40 repeat protein